MLSSLKLGAVYRDISSLKLACTQTDSLKLGADVRAYL